MKQHPLSKIFPAMPEDELSALAADIAANGLRQPLMMYEGAVLDGWHRYLACRMAKAQVKTMDYRGSDPVGLVKSTNWHRRHLTASQKALAQVQLSEWAATGKPAKGDSESPLQTVAEMAKEAGTDERTIQRAKRVEESGTKELKEAVIEGTISINKAEHIARKSKAKQAKAIKEAKEKKPRKQTAKQTAGPSHEEKLKTVTEELERADKEIRSLQDLVASLQKDAPEKELAKLHAKYAALEGRLQLAVTQKNEADKQAKYSTGMLTKIRAALKVKSNSEILQAIRE